MTSGVQKSWLCHLLREESHDFYMIQVRYTGGGSFFIDKFMFHNAAVQVSLEVTWPITGWYHMGVGEKTATHMKSSCLTTLFMCSCQNKGILLCTDLRVHCEESDVKL